MAKIKYDFQIAGCRDDKRVDIADGIIFKSFKSSENGEHIATDNYTIKDGTINYYMLYEPSAVIILKDWYSTEEYLVNSAPLEVICQETKCSEVKATLEKILGTPLVIRTKENATLKDVMGYLG